jgi:hypothetical protein
VKSLPRFSHSRRCSDGQSEALAASRRFARPRHSTVASRGIKSIPHEQPVSNLPIHTAHPFAEG